MRRVALVVLLVLPVLAGCLATGPDGSAPADAADPVDDLTERPDLVTPEFLDPVHLPGHAGIGAEPTVAVAPNGTVYVETVGTLWRSDDGGRSYEPLGEPVCWPVEGVPTCPAGMTRYESDTQGGGDGDTAVDADGTLYWVGLVSGSEYVPFQVSTDGGATFSDPLYLKDEFVDRQWIEARPNGTLYVSWIDEQVEMRTSFDGGDHWTDVRQVGPASVAGPPVAAPGNATVYLPYADDGIHLARSSDHGASWNHSTVAELPSVPADGPFGESTIFPVAAVDAAGNVYVVWSWDPARETGVRTQYTAVPHVYLAVSLDGGRTFRDPVRLSPEDKAAIYPWIDAGKAGRIAVAWYENEHGVPHQTLPDRWNVRLVESVDADRPEPTFEGGLANDAPFHVGTICTQGLYCTLTAQDRSMLDFFEVAIGPDGQPRVAWAADPETGRGPVQVFAGGVAEGTALR